MEDELKRGSIEEGRDGKKYLFLGGDRHDKSNWKQVNPLTIATQQQRLEDAVRAPQEALTALATGSVAAPISGLTGLLASAYPGPAGQGADVAERTRQALTYSPSPEGMQIVNDLTKPLQWWSEKAQAGGGQVTDITGSPLLGTAASSALEFLPAMLVKAAKGPVTKARSKAEIKVAGLAADKLSKNQTWLAAQKEGYKLPPSAMGGGFVSNRLESVGGKAAIGQDFAIHNQAVTNAIARREAGLRPEQILSEETLAEARFGMAAPYREISQLSTRAASALERLQASRHEAKLYWRHYNISGDPASYKQARKFDVQADLLEKVIEKEARKAGKADLLSRLDKARVAIAKNHAVDRALNEGAGEVDAHAFAKMLGKGEKLTGGLETVGKFAQSFRHYTREASGVPAPGISKSEALASAALGLGGQAGDMGWWPAGLPLVAPPVRSFLRTPLMQPGAQPFPQIPLSLRGASAATAYPELYTLMPGIGMIGTRPEDYVPELRQRR